MWKTGYPKLEGKEGIGCYKGKRRYESTCGNRQEYERSKLGGETWEGGEFRGTERIRRKVFVAPIEKVESRGTREQQLNGKLEGPFVRFQADPLASSELFASEYRKSPVNKRRGGKVPSFFTKKTTIFQSWPTRWKLHRQRRNGFEARRLPLFVFSSLARTIRGNKVKEKEGCRRDSQVRIPVSASREVEKGVQTYLRIYLSFQNISGEGGNNLNLDGLAIDIPFVLYSMMESQRRRRYKNWNVLSEARILE